jgi:hypothetical protein
VLASRTNDPLIDGMPASSNALSIPKSNPWKNARQLGSTRSGFTRYWSYNSAKNEVCAVFKKEYLSIEISDVVTGIMHQKYNI